MHNNIVCRAYFSPHGTTKKIMDCIANEFQGIRLICDFLKPSTGDEVSLNNRDLLIIGVPVFSGRVPKICVDQINELQGNQTPAVIYVTYGNRAYDDALLELKDILTKNGFRVLSAAAFVCEHSIFENVAKGHPNQKDMEKVKEFAQISKYIFDNYSKKYTTTLKIDGNQQYRKATKIPLVPHTTDNCTSCQTCVSICPTQAISKKHPYKTNRLKCIACTACIYACPNKARQFQGIIFEKARGKFEEDNKELKRNEIFI